MSFATVVYEDYENNDYRIRVPGTDSNMLYKAQRISYKPAVEGKIVELVDIDNLDPQKASSFGNLRIKGSLEKVTENRWFSSEEMYNKDYKANLFKAFMYSSKENPRWQTECPTYRKGTITSVVDTLYLEVQVFLDGFSHTLKCPVEYSP